MSEKPIIFSGPMVKAILEGRKTMTRRVIKPQPDLGLCEFERYSHIHVGIYNPALVDKDGNLYPGDEIFGAYTDDGEWGWKCPYGQPGDRLWVRETHTWVSLGGNDSWTRAAERDGTLKVTDGGVPVRMCYKADGWDIPANWQPSIHMPRWASRITLEITGVRVEKLQEIEDHPEDYRKEGYSPLHLTNQHGEPFEASVDFAWFENLWDSINAKRGYGWANNPWCWCISFH